MSKDFDEDLDMDLEDEKKDEGKAPPPTKAPVSKTPVSKPAAIKSKTPAGQGKAQASAAAGPKKNIFFKTTVGPERTEKLSIGTSTPVRDVKSTLANIFGLNPDDFHLSHAGRTMDEDAPVSDYNVDNGDEVLLIPQSTAG